MAFNPSEEADLEAVPVDSTAQYTIEIPASMDELALDLQDRGI